MLQLRVMAEENLKIKTEQENFRKEFDCLKLSLENKSRFIEKSRSN
jgi:hypothetical protein